MRNVRFFPFFKEKFFSPRFLFSSSTEFAFFFFFWLVSEIYPLSYLVSFNRCQNKMCRNEAFSFFFSIFATTRGVYLTRMQKRLKNNSSTCSFLFFLFLRLIIEHIIVWASRFALINLHLLLWHLVRVCI